MQQQLPAFGVWLGKAPAIALCVLIMLSLAAPAVVHLSGQSTDPTPLDNHRPAPLPSPPTTIDQFDEFREGMADYIGDNFGLRAEMLRLNARLRITIGLPAVPSLMLGRDNWHFLRTHHDILDQHRGLNRFTEVELDSWIDFMERRQAELESQGIAFALLIAPNQQTVYPDYMPIYANRAWPETRFDQIVRRLRERQSKLNLVDPRPALWAARNAKAVLYHRYESHWNALGAFLAYAEIMRSVETKIPRTKILKLSDFDIGKMERTWAMPPLTEEIPVMTLKSPRKIDPNAPRVFVYGDSFLGSLLSHLQGTFKSVEIVSRNVPFPHEAIHRDHPDLVIYEMVERQLNSPLNKGN